MQVRRKRPETINRYFLAQAQGRTDQEEARRQPLGVNPFALPELSSLAQKVGVSKDHRLLRTNVCEGVINPERRLRSPFHGEGRHVDVALVVDFNTVHKGFPRPQKVLEPMGEKEQKKIRKYIVSLTATLDIFPCDHRVLSF